MRVAVVDCLATGSAGRRFSSVDVVGSGPRLVVGILRSLGVEAELFECSDVIEGRVELGGFDALMVSGMSSDLASMAAVLRRWRDRGPAVAGGPACTDYEELLRYGFTAVAWGEAELSLPKLVEGLSSGDLGSVPNVIYRESGRTVSRVRPGYAVEPLLWSFQPDVESVRRYRYYWACRVYVEVVRGCSNFLRTTLPLPLLKGGRCSGCGVCRSRDLEARLSCPLGVPPGCGYCVVPALYGPARSRPVARVVEEVEGLVELGVRRVVLSAPDFLDYGRDWLVRPKPLTDPREPPANLEAIEELLSSLQSIGRVSRGEVHIMVENVKPNLVTEEVARLLGRYLRGTTVNIGLESGDPEHHLALGRPSRVEEILRAVRLLSEAGLRPYVYVIYGLPGESWRTVRNTIKVLRKAYKLGAERVILYRFRPLKASAFEGCPEPHPGDPRDLALRRFVEALERRSKRQLLGRVVRVAVVDRYGRAGDTYVGYTLPHGPVVVVRSNEDLVGKVVDVRVVKVGARKVYGVPVGS